MWRKKESLATKLQMQELQDITQYKVCTGVRLCMLLITQDGTTHSNRAPPRFQGKTLVAPAAAKLGGRPC